MRGDFDELVQMFVEHKYKGVYWGIEIIRYATDKEWLQIGFIHKKELSTSIWKSDIIISEPIVIHVSMWEVINFMWLKLRTIPI